MRRWLGLALLASACGRFAFDQHDASDSDGGEGSGDSAAPTPCDLPVPWDRGATYSRTIYVAPNGADTNDGSSTAPLLTIAGARPLLVPGTRLIVRPGTYAAVQLVDLAGTIDQPIAITGESGAVIDGVPSDSCLGLVRPTYVVVEGLHI